MLDNIRSVKSEIEDLRSRDEVRNILADDQSGQMTLLRESQSRIEDTVSKLVKYSVHGNTRVKNTLKEIKETSKSGKKHYSSTNHGVTKLADSPSSTVEITEKNKQTTTTTAGTCVRDVGSYHVHQNDDEIIHGLLLLLANQWCVGPCPSTRC